MRNFLLFVVYGIPSVAFLLLGLTILINQRADTTKRVFALFCLLFSLWVGFLYLTDLVHNPVSRLALLRTAILIGNFIPPVFLLFCLRFTQKQANWALLLGATTTAVLAIFSYSDAMIGTIKPGLGAQPDNLGLLYQLQSAYTAVFFLAGILTLFIGTRHNTIKRSQVRIIIVGLGVSVTINLITGFVLAAAGAEEQVGLIGPPSMLLFIGSMYYAIARYRVFDIRPYLSRISAFIVTVAFVICAMVTIRLTLVNQVNDTTLRTVADLASLAIIVLMLPRASALFRKLANKLFFRAYYDPATALNEATIMLAYERSIASLSDKTLGFLTKLLNIDGALLYIAPSNYAPEHFASLGIKLDKRALGQVAPFGEQQEWLHHDELLARKPSLGDLELLIPLGSGDDYQGVLGVGLKRSGTPLDDNDYRFLAVFSNSLRLAISNARGYEEITQFAEILKVEVDRATRQLKRTNRSLSSVSAAKDEFMSMAAHQLRPQLTATQGFVELMLRGGGGKASREQKEILNLALSSVSRMIRLVNDMLNAVRFTSGKFEIEFGRLDLNQLVAKEVKGLQLLAKKQEVELDYQSTHKAIWVEGDEIKLREVILNFVDNAIHYSTAHTQVSVRLVANDTTAVLTVTDQGIGVPKEAHKRLFHKFFRAENARAARPAGTGIGLFVAKKVIEGHHGSIIFKSEVGKGSIFGFSMPVHQITGLGRSQSD